MKKLPGAVLESIDKMKGSMLLSMAKGMTAHDAETMARHWGYVPDVTPSQQVKAFQKERTDVIAETIIPERPTTPAIEALLKSMNEKDSVKVPALEITEILTGDISKEASITPSDDTLRTMDVVINDERMIEKTIADESLIIHPIFGKKIVDLGYKTVYLTSVSLLAKTQVWERQRTLRPDRAARIASSKIALGRAKSLSGVITMFCDKSSGQSGIVDGQHRSGALMMLAQQGHWEGHEMNILIDVFETQNDDEITALFKEINSAEPVRLVDMPGEVN